MFVKNLKVVFVYRNVKDLAVSYYHHHIRFPEYKYHDTFTHYIRRFAAGLGMDHSFLRTLEAVEIRVQYFSFVTRNMLPFFLPSFSLSLPSLFLPLSLSHSPLLF